MSREFSLGMRLRPEQPEEEDERIINFRLSPDDFEVAMDVHADRQEKFIGELEEARVELTPAQAEVISMANDVIADVLRDYDLDLSGEVYAETDVVPLDFAAYKKITKQETAKTGWSLDSVGQYIPEQDKAILWYKTKAWAKNDDRNNEILHTISHELLHAKSYRALQAFRAGEKTVVEGYRSGLHLVKLGNPEHTMFRGLNEAITESLALEATNRLVNERRDLFEKRFKQQILYELYSAQRYATSKFPRINDMRKRWKAWVASLPRNEYGQVFDRSEKDFIEQIFVDPTYEYAHPEDYSAYSDERHFFETLLSAIARKNPEYAGKEREIRALFYQAYMTGQMLPIGRLVEKTFGKGTFRLISKILALGRGARQLSEEERNEQSAALEELEKRLE